MKKLIAITIFSLILLGCTFGQELYISDSGTVGWVDDKMIDGIPYPGEAVVEYEIVLCYENSDHENVDNYLYLGTATAEEYLYDISGYEWQRYDIGIRVVLNGISGDYAWSSVPEDCAAGLTFSVVPLSGLVPDKIKGLMVK